MARIGTGSVTIVDVKDGIAPISFVMSNQSHTFAADNAGTVPTAERTAFSCELYAFVGSTRCTYDDTAPYGNNTYRITKTDTAGWATTNTITNGQSVLTMTTIPTGTVNKTCQTTITVTVVNELGNETELTGVISFSKAIEGANGQVVTLTPNRQTFRFNELGVTTDGNITIGVSTVGNTGALSAQYSRNGGAWAALAVGAGANQATSIDIDGAGGNDQIVISAANFGTADTFSIKVAGATGGQDVITIIKVQDGSTGPAAILPVIKSDIGGFQFKNNAGSTKTLSVTVYDMKDGSILTPTAWQWKKNGVNIASTATITVTASDITDNGSELYSCEVTVP